MVYHNFDELIQKVGAHAKAGIVAVAAAADRHTLEAVLEAQRARLATPLLVGDAEKIRDIYRELGEPEPPAEILFNVPDPAQACRKAVALVKSGLADFLMKGMIDTKTYLSAVVDRENGLGTGRIMSHFSILEVPGYHKLVVPVDGGMIPYPTLEQKKDIILNCVEIFHKLGCEQPKVAVLACTEQLNPKFPETVEAAQLKEMNQRGDIPGCIVEGPVSYDCAISKEIALVKGFHSPVSGETDILLAPNIHAANILGKTLVVSCKARMAGFIVGASCPVIMTSRGTSSEEKFLSIALAAAVTAK